MFEETTRIRNIYTNSLLEQNNTCHKIENREHKCDKQNRKDKKQQSRKCSTVQKQARKYNKIQKLNTKTGLEKTTEIRHRLMKSEDNT